MSETDRPVIITGNWKMYKTIEESLTFVKELIPLVESATTSVYLAVPFTAIKSVAEQAKGSKIVVGAQNMHDASDGAFTGEIAASMLIDAGARFVILGHSERRILFKESNDVINRKLKRAIKEKLQPVLCIGETLAEREQNLTAQTLSVQLTECLSGIEASQLENLIIAYEPVWAIGTDKSATPAEAQEAHHLCREWLQQAYGENLSRKTVIQYGGSVKPENAKELLEQPDIDGLLVGGASLSADSFSKIVNLT